ncbi:MULTISPECIES: ATP-grasp domain-containing protein [unclassified Mesorhizobium]|uniref:ATP-grasp domain-containing protein n=1 Tax=unclassified Mesorhizobium TaxID=325217 RepID=UPI00333AC185
MAIVCPVGELKPFEITGFKTLSGLNVYNANTVVKLSLNLGQLATARVSSFTDEVRLVLSGLFPECEQDALVASYLADAILAADLELRRAMNFYSFPTVATLVSDPSESNSVIVWESDDPQMSRAAASAVVDAVSEATRDGDATSKYSLARELNLERAKKRRLSNSTAVLVAAAKRNRIPFEFVARNHLRLGQGKNQKQLFSTISGSTSFASAKVALDKRLGNRLLAQAGLPVPRQLTVRSKSEAVAAAKQLGKSVVVKPAQGNQGRGVSVKLRGRRAIEAAFDIACQVAQSDRYGVLVEEFIAGPEYRATIVDFRVVAAVLCCPPQVTGDGEKTLRHLIDDLNREPDRDGRRLSPLEIDDDLLRHLSLHHLTMETIPIAGQQVVLRPNGHLARGGVPVDVTNSVHPDNHKLCERIARVIGLSIAGLDLIMPDIAQSHKDVGCTVIEVNARPGIEFHLWPRAGTARDVSEIILANMYDDPASSEVATVLVLGDRHTSMVAKAIQHRFMAEGRSIGLLSKKGAYINTAPQEFSQRATPQMLARDPLLEALVYAASPARISENGLGLGACHAVSVTATDVENCELLKNLAKAVLNAGNRGCFIVDNEDFVSRQALSALPVERLILTSAETELGPDLRRHLQRGGLALSMRWSTDGSGAKMTLASGSGELVAEPATFASRPPQLKAAMHAMAISYLAKRDAWFDEVASPPSNRPYANGVQQQAGVSLLR